VDGELKDLYLDAPQLTFDIQSEWDTFQIGGSLSELYSQSPSFHGFYRSSWDTLEVRSRVNDYLSDKPSADLVFEETRVNLDIDLLAEDFPIFSFTLQTKDYGSI
jgi:hypothetical protein